jgi:hypothetical protein
MLEYGRPSMEAMAPYVHTLAETVWTTNSSIGIIAKEYAKGSACCRQKPCFLTCTVKRGVRVIWCRSSAKVSACWLVCSTLVLL